MAGKRTSATYNLDAPGDNTAKAAFAHNLQNHMVELGFSQSELARRCGALLPRPEKGQKQRLTFGRDLISRYIRGETLPRPEALDLLAQALRCKSSDLLPPESVPHAGKLPETDIKYLSEDRVFLRVNRPMRMMTATKIIGLLNVEDAK